MRKDTEMWLRYADDNLKSAKVLLDSELYNPCLQNALKDDEITSALEIDRIEEIPCHD